MEINLPTHLCQVSTPLLLSFRNPGPTLGGVRGLDELIHYTTSLWYDNCHCRSPTLSFMVSEVIG